ncbi:MAG: glutamate 5-kinase [Clostridia bacterium]|nr:glutamate 5-kinase [Clostridia bacterium]
MEIKEAKRIVVKVGTSTLTYENGRLNLRRIEQLVKVICDLTNSGKEIVLVSSGAIGVGVGKLGLKNRPSRNREKQAVAAVGQCELMFIYDKLFGEYNHNVAQVLLTKFAVDTEHKKQNVINTMETLLEMGIIPIVNENDTCAIDELDGDKIGDNDRLSAIVAEIVNADLLVMLTDIDGLYNKNPKNNPDAEKIEVVEEITDEIRTMASGSGSNRGTGGMITKIIAAEYATSYGIECCIMNGETPKRLYDLFDGKKIGTVFKSVRANG